MGFLLLAIIYSPVFLSAYLASSKTLHWGWAGLLGAVISVFFAVCVKKGMGT